MDSVSAIKTTVSVRKQKMERYKAMQLKKMKTDLRNMAQFFRDIKSPHNCKW